MSNKNNFIRFCGELVFDPENCRWDSLSPEQKNEYCILAQKTGMQDLFVRFLQKRLPEAYYNSFRRSYQKASYICLIENHRLSELYHFFETEKIPFIPIKGADLAFRVYPDQVLRPHGDWDILFRKEDCPKVIQLLQKRGWKTFSGYEPGDPGEHHHYQRMHDESCVLEVHWTLPDFGSADADEIWKNSKEINTYHHVLTPEMNLLLISAHASHNSFTHVSQWKILTDAGVLLKFESVDWNNVHRLADLWGILRPDILFRCWSEFFPEGILPEESSIPEQQKLIQDIFEMRSVVSKYSVYEKSVTKAESHNIRWFLNKLKFYTPAQICSRYHIPPHQHIKIAWQGIRDFLEKAFFFLTYSKSDNPELQEYYQKVAALEKLIKHDK